MLPALFNNIPQEMREYGQWVCWRLEKREGAKPTKVPYAPRPGGGKAAVDNPETWGTFAEACAAPFTCLEPCDSDQSLDETGLSGIGFVFTENDPYLGIDLDYTHGDEEADARQMKIYTDFASYSELSPSGNGLHIIVKAKIPQGRRRASIELYSSHRYFTMTGNVYLNAPIAERQEQVDILFNEMGGAAQTYQYGEDKEQKETDEEIIATAMNAANGEKFRKLYTGDWHSLYSSQSEADFALIDIIAFYTQNRAQIKRMFRTSELGQREKAQRDDYVNYMVNKAFDRQIPQVDIEGLKIAFDSQKASGGAAVEPGGTTAEPNDTGLAAHTADTASHGPSSAVNSFPPGLLGEVAQFILDAAPRPVPDIALAGAIGLLSAITGRAYNVSGQGLNQYILLLASTGAGKDAMSSGISKLMAAVQKSVPCASEFRGPGELVSSAGLIKWLDKKPACLTIVGEFGIKLKEMSSPTANAHVQGLQRILLQLYSKSGKGNVLDPMAYSDSLKNTSAIASPSFVLLGESVPEVFYEALDEQMISGGLLPRFMLFEHKGQRVYLKEGTEKVEPSFSLTQQIADLCASCLGLAHNGNVNNVQLDNAATHLFREFEKWTTDKINESRSENIKQLWNRAHLKAMKLAAVCSVGINPVAPVVDINAGLWARDMIVAQTNRLIAKFETGNIGNSNGSENKQLKELVRVISSYLHEPYERYAKYGCSLEMHRSGVITEAHISRRLVATACFKNDKRGPTAAIKLGLKNLLDADELREVPKLQMQNTYGTGPRAFVVASASRFLPRPDDD